MNQEQKRKKLLNRYLDPKISKTNKYSENDQYNWMEDLDDAIRPQSSQQSQQSEDVGERRRRIGSSDQQDKEEYIKKKEEKRKEKENKKERKLKKKLRKALGLGKDQQVKQFLQNLQVEGIQKDEILQYLAKNKNTIIKKEQDQAIKQQKESKKKKDKKKDNESENNKFKMFEKSQSSDLEIPEEARTKTIYRNKDGTIRQTSQKEQKQIRKRKVMERLAQWEKGMKKENSEDEKEQAHEDVEFAKNNKVWDDPMKRWQAKNPMKLVVCKYQGPPNRYNIKPGFRWDGVVRGNGFQNRYLQQINLKKAKKDQEHKQYMRDL